MRWWLLVFACASCFAQSAETLFTAHCAPCHGPKGDGGKGASLAVPRLTRARSDADLLTIILGGIPGTEMPPSRMTEKEASLLVAYVRELGRVAAASAKGDATRGTALYRGKGKCAQCHQISGEGGAIGPDLTEIGSRRNPAHLRQSLVAPEASIPDNFTYYRRIVPIPDNFLQVRVVTRDGRRITGARLNEDPFSIQLRDYSDRVHSFWKSELQEVHKDWGKSPMPNYSRVFTPPELDDVVAYLSSLRQEP